MVNDSRGKFTEDQILILKASAQNLMNLLENSDLVAAESLLKGGLREILETVIFSEVTMLFEDVPHFSLMTRGILPAKETKAYFNFYSMACSGELAYTNKKN